MITAIANDTGYENIFLNQLKIHYKTGDLLIILSASGNSLNLIKACEWVKKKSGKTIGILGFDGGKLLKKCDLTIHIKTEKNEYGPVEDVQLILNHIFAHWFQKNTLNNLMLNKSTIIHLEDMEIDLFSTYR